MDIQCFVEQREMAILDRRSHLQPAFVALITAFADEVLRRAVIVEPGKLVEIGGKLHCPVGLGAYFIDHRAQMAEQGVELQC